MAGSEEKFFKTKVLRWLENVILRLVFGKHNVLLESHSGFDFTRVTQ